MPRSATKNVLQVVEEMREGGVAEAREEYIRKRVVRSTRRKDARIWNVQ